MYKNHGTVNTFNHFKKCYTALWYGKMLHNANHIVKDWKNGMFLKTVNYSVQHKAI